MLFQSAERLRFILPSLVESIKEMETERVKSGVETTPDETSNVIEGFYHHIGRLWIAELLFLTERATDESFEGQENIFRYLYDSLSNRGGNFTIGRFCASH